MIGVEPFLPFLKGSCDFGSVVSSLCPCLRGLRKFEHLCSLFDLCLIDSILSHDFLCPFSPFFRDHVIFFFVSVASSRCPCLRGLRFCFFRIISAFSLGFWIFWEKLCSFSSLTFRLSDLCGVLSMHSSRGRLRTSGGHPYVMSD